MVAPLIYIIQNITFLHVHTLWAGLRLLYDG